MISADTKDALTRDIPQERHCRGALLAGLALYGSNGGEFITHRNAIARLFWSLLDERKAHPIETRAPTRLHHLPTFAIALPERLRSFPPKPVRKCDRLIEVRAALLACGSLAAGAHGYHLEFVIRSAEVADRLTWMLRSIGAFGAVLQLEDVRALRETKNRIHRLVNTEAANLQRSAQAAAAHRRVIEYLQSAYGLPRLSPALREVAELRLKYPDESLAEIGRRCNPAISKPAVSGRLATLSRLAESIAGVQGSAKPVR
jgi:DNA-binding transcriptional regulator WhiA